MESSISLEGKYPQFAMEGDDKSDIVVRFSQCDNAKVVLSEEAEEDIGGPLEMHMTSDGEKLAAVRFPGAVKRWKLERFVDADLCALFAFLIADALPSLPITQNLCTLRRR